jgi:hypothetical protein
MGLFKPTLPIASNQHLEAQARQAVRHHFQVARVVIDDQDGVLAEIQITRVSQARIHRSPSI